MSCTRNEERERDSALLEKEKIVLKYIKITIIFRKK
jgi:hypothetical protein